MHLRRDSVLYHSLLLTGSSVTLQLLGFVYRILLGRAAGPQVMAVHGLVMSAYNVVLSCTLTGIALSVSRIASRYIAVGSGQSVKRLIATALGMFLGLFIVLAVPFGLNREFFAQTVLGNGDTAPALLLLIPCLFLTGFENVHKAYFYGSCDTVPPMISEIGEMCLRIGATAWLFWRLGQGLEPARAAAVIVLGMVISEVLSATFLTLCYRIRRRRLTGKDRIGRRQIVGDILSTAAPISLSTLFSRLLSSANVVLIPRTLVHSGRSMEDALTLFGAVSGMTMPLLMLPSAFLYPLITVLTPRFSAGAALRDQAQIRRKAAKAIHVTGLIGFPAMSALLCMGRRLAVILYNNPNAGIYLAPLALSAMLGFYYSVCESVLEGIGLQKRCSVLGVVASLCSLGCTALVGGVLRLGVWGFLVGEICYSLVGMVFCAVWVVRTTGLVIRWQNWFLRPGLAAVGGILPVRLVYLWLLELGIAPLLVTAFCGALYALVYSILLRALGVDAPAYLKTVTER